MKKLSLFSLICIVTIIVFALSVVADGSISKVMYSNSDIFFEGSLMELINPPVLIFGADETDQKTYLPLRELFEGMGYEVDWRAEDGSIHIQNPSPTPTEAPPETDNPNAPIFVAEAEGARLFMIAGGEWGHYSMLTYEDASQTFEWMLLSPRFQYPEIYVRDFDGDGELEIAVLAWPASGTGIFFNELHMIEAVREDGRAKELVSYDFNTYLDYIDSAVSFEAEETEGGWLIRTKCGEREVTAIVDYPPVPGEIRQANMRGGLWNCEITVTEEGFHLSMPLCVQTQHAIPAAVARLEVDFSYTPDGGFEFAEPVISEDVW